MKRVIFVLAVVILGIIAGLLRFVCAGTSIKQLSGPEFMNKAKQSVQITSFNWTSYIGYGQSSRAYLECGYPSLIGGGMKVVVYWTPLSELPSDIVERINAGKRPLENWMEKNGQQSHGGDGGDAGS